MKTLTLSFIGTGTAWPVYVSEHQRFYDPGNATEISNSAFLIQREMDHGKVESLLVDAGFGVIPYLLQHGNLLPDALVLTHAHLDHTASIDWIAHSYAKTLPGNGILPVYCSRLTQQAVLQTFPQLRDKLEFKCLLPGIQQELSEIKGLSITSYPVYHGDPAKGAQMIRVDVNGEKKVLFTGDLVCPVLRKKDFLDLQGIPVIVSDANNCYPYPKSNHWSILPYDNHGEIPVRLQEFISALGPSQILSTQLVPSSDPSILKYFDDWLLEWGEEELILSITDFADRIKPGKVFLVHYSGREDVKYYQEKPFTRDELQKRVNQAGKGQSEFTVPEPGTIIKLN